MPKITHLSITQSGITALLGNLVTAIVTVVPAWGSEKQVIVAALGGLVSNLFPLVNAIHKLADSNVSTKDVEAGAIAVARSEISKVDFTSLVQTAVDAKSIPDLEAKVSSEVQAAVSRLFQAAAPGPGGGAAPIGSGPTPVA